MSTIHKYLFIFNLNRSHVRKARVSFVSCFSHICTGYTFIFDWYHDCDAIHWCDACLHLYQTNTFPYMWICRPEHLCSNKVPHYNAASSNILPLAENCSFSDYDVTLTIVTLIVQPWRIFSNNYLVWVVWSALIKSDRHLHFLITSL